MENYLFGDKVTFKCKFRDGFKILKNGAIIMSSPANEKKITYDIYLNGVQYVKIPVEWILEKTGVYTAEEMYRFLRTQWEEEK